MSITVTIVGIVVGSSIVSTVVDECSELQQSLVHYTDTIPLVLPEGTVQGHCQPRLSAQSLSPLLLCCRLQRCCSGFADQRRSGPASRKVSEVASNDNNPSPPPPPPYLPNSTLRHLSDPLLPCLLKHMYTQAMFGWLAYSAAQFA